jgi:alcohol dehydrogenase
VALGAIKLVAEWLPILMADLSNLDARLHIQTASHMAGIAFGISGLGICHAVGHPLSALLNKAHGQTLSTMLPHVMDFNLPVRADKYALVAEAFGVRAAGASDEENARAAIKAVAELSISVGTAMSIEAMGGTPEIIAEAVQQAITDLCILSNARPATAADILGMYEKAMSDPVLYPVEEAVLAARL